jgi:predicted aconitase
MSGIKRLTPEQREVNRKEKAERLKLKGKAMIARAKQIESKEKQKEKKERTRELIQIGAIIAQFHDKKKLLEYLKNFRIGVELSNNSMRTLKDSEKNLGVGDKMVTATGEEAVILKRFVHLGWTPI